MFIINKKETEAPSTSIGLRLPNELKERLDCLANDTGVNRNQIILQAITYALKNMKKNHK